jgi:DNA primase
MSTDNAVEEIKSRLDIVELVSDYVAIKRAGQNFKGLCPFHAEKTPSFMVSRPKQIFHCFGCSAGGDIFGFVMRYEGLTFPEALELLAKKAGVELAPRKPGERGLKDSIKAANRDALDFFKASLERSGPAKSYLKKRGIGEEAQVAFTLGYAPEGWHGLHEHLKKKGVNEAMALKAGLCASGQKGPYDIFRGRIIFPIFDLHGEAVAFGGRVMGEEQPKYLNSPDTPVFSKRKTLYALPQAKDAIREADEAVVVEGYLDAIACHQHGIKNTVAPLGTALTTEHVKLLGRYAHSVVLVFDGDAAGVAAARRSLEIILPEGLEAKVLLLPEGEDPDSVLNEKGPEHLMKLIAGGYSPVDFMLKASSAGKVDTVKEVLQAIARVNDPLRRDELLRELSEKTDTREITLREELKRLGRAGRQAAGATGRQAPEGKSKGLAYSEEVFLLSTSTSVPGKAGEILERISPEDFKDGLIRGIFIKLNAAPDQAPAEVAETDEEKALVAKLSLEPGFDISEADRVVNDCIRKIERRQVDEKIEAARSAGDMALLSRLLGERQKFIQEAR